MPIFFQIMNCVIEVGQTQIQYQRTKKLRSSSKYTVVSAPHLAQAHFFNIENEPSLSSYSLLNLLNWSQSMLSKNSIIFSGVNPINTSPLTVSASMECAINAYCNSTGSL